jgi:hypothetical protein
VTAPAAVDQAKVDGHRGRWKLGEWIRPGHLATVPDMPRVVAAIDRWQTGQLMLGRQVLNRARSAGDRSQFENTCG